MARNQCKRSSMLERGVQVLQAFRPNGGALTLPMLIARTGLPKATVFRLAESLVELGLLERLRSGYRPGLGLLELGELVPAKVDLREAALPFMQDLYEATHEIVHLGIRDDIDVVYAEKIRGHTAAEVPTRVGTRLPLSSTGVGKALLAFSEPEIVTAVLSRPLRRLTDRSHADPAALAQELAEIRQLGIAVDREEAMLGVSCVAAPVIAGGQAVAALSIALPTERMHLVCLMHAVKAVALALSRTLARSGDVSRATLPA